LLDILIPYIIKRVTIYTQPWALEGNESRKKSLWKFLVRMEEIFKFLKLMNFITFLFDGKYVSLVNRLLSLRLVPQQHTARVISFDYLNRQLIWNGLTEFMLFIVPKINITSIKDRFWWLRYGYNLSQKQCEICEENATNPHVDENGNCSHTYCYWCIRVKMIEQENHFCSRCQTTITSIIPQQL